MQEKNLEVLSQKLGIPFVKSIDNIDISSEVINRLPPAFMKQYKFIPLKAKDDVLTIATCQPLNVHTFDDIARLSGFAMVEPILTLPEEIERAINNYLSSRQTSPQKLMEDIQEPDFEIPIKEQEKPEDLLDLANKPPIIKLVNSVLFQAVNDRATDVHIQPAEDSLKIRYRVDGVLYDAFTFSKRYQQAIISRIKVMSRLDIAEQRLPQDGRATIKLGDRAIDIRLSCVPSSFGERVVMRLLEKSAGLLELEQLGFSNDNLRQIEGLIHLSHGIILVTGPTGSGKTTTLYATLNRINSAENNIITIEDPIEYQLPGISQIQVKPKIGLDFASGLRSMLRQDPDIIMVGEIRDLETATIAIQSSLTGHLVFSTLHTNDTPGALTRLIDLGIEPYLISSSVVAILAQRLVRLICRSCAKSYVPSEQSLNQLGLDKTRDTNFLKGIGCSECLKTGYKGRTAIVELLIMNDDIKNMVLERASSGAIKHKAQKQGMITLLDDGIKKVREGLTTVEEVLKVTQEA